MTDENELSRRLAATAGAIDGEPDLDDVLARSLHKQNRSRRMATLSAATVAVVGVGALVLAANREPRPTSDRPPIVATTPPPATPAADPGTNVVVPTNPPDTPATTPVQPSTSQSTTAPDPAEPFLDQTEVVFDQVMDDDFRFVVRISNASYGELFDIDWTAPTGSADECLSGPALLFGDPDGRRETRNEASSWEAWALSPLSDAHPTDVVDPAGPFNLRVPDESITSVFVVRTQLPVTDLVVEGEGITSTPTKFINGIAVVEVTSDLVPIEAGSGTRTTLFDQATLTLQPEPGSNIDPELLTLPLVDNNRLGLNSPDCLPPDPQVELPSPGQQPTDPASAETIIRERFALAVDQNIAFDDKPDDLFDSNIGLEQAINEALTGGYGDYVRSARYEIVDLVFTSPDEAWFLYDLDAQGVMYQPFGRATLDGESWQISRDTICQDLARAGVACDPSPSTETVQPPSDNTDPPPTTLTDQERAAYSNALYCNPIQPCDES